MGGGGNMRSVDVDFQFRKVKILDMDSGDGCLTKWLKW